MAKNDVSKDNSDQSDNTAPVTSVSKAESNREIEIVFKENRTFELHVGGSVIVFSPNGRQKVPQSIIDHKDFKSVAHYFVIRG